MKKYRTIGEVTPEISHALRTLGFHDEDYQGLRRAVEEGKRLLKTDGLERGFLSLEKEYSISDLRYVLREGRRERQRAENDDNWDTH